MIETQVLIGGGGPVGLSASIFLSRFGIRSLLVERHPGVSRVPKARGINARTMEIYRQCGVEDAVRAAGLAPEKTGFIVWTESLAGREIERRVPGRMAPKNRGMSPVLNCLCAQDDLEPVLRRYAETYAEADVRFNTELTGAVDRGDQIEATILDRATNQVSTVRAQYLIAADGAQSRFRDVVGAKMIGEANVYDSVNIVFNADLRPWTADRPSALYFVEQPDLRGTFLTINAHDRWGFLIHSLSHYGYTPADFTDEKCAQLIRQAVGVADLDVKILGVSPWQASAHVADRYRKGRIFLAGDSAHEMTPTGGFGLNTGVQDAHNLCWKLAAVLKNEADAALLDTYHDERQPTGLTITKATLENALSMGRTARQTTATTARPQFLAEQGLIFGLSYDSAAVASDGSPEEIGFDPVTEYIPTARPGRRAPHVELERAGKPISTIDLFGDGFVLLAGPNGQAWAAAAKQLHIQAHVVGDDIRDPDGQWCDKYGIGADGAVLVRPDGYVGWRSQGPVTDPAATVAEVMARILGRT